MAVPDTAAAGLSTLETVMQSHQYEPSAIRKRLPGKLESDEQRALICAVRNPYGDPLQYAATTGVSEIVVYEAFANWLALNGGPDTGSLSPVHRTALDIIIEDYDGKVDSVDPEKLASTAGRQADNLTNEAYMQGFLNRDDFETLLTKRHVERMIDERGANAGTARALLTTPGTHDLLIVLGENPPASNLDMLDDPEPEPKRADYERPPRSITKDLIQPNVDYYAEVNGVMEWGIFINLTRPAQENDPVNALVHKSKFPPLVRPQDYEQGDQVGVRLVRRKENGDLEFQLVANIDTVRHNGERWPQTLDFVDERNEETVPAEPTEPEESEPIAEPGPEDIDEPMTADPGDEAKAEADAEPEQLSFTEETNNHAILTVLAEKAPEREQAMQTGEVKVLRHTTDERVVSGTLNNLYNRDLVDRQVVPDAPRKLYEYWVTPAGHATLDRVGPDPRVDLNNIDPDDNIDPDEAEADAGDDDDEEHVCENCGKTFETAQGLGGHRRFCDADDADEDEYVCPYCEKTFSSSKAVNGHLRWCDERPDAVDEDDEDEPDTAPAPEPPEPEPAKPEPEPPMADDDEAREQFKYALMMRVGMVRGKYDLPPEDAAAVLREVADRVEQGGL